MRWLMLAAALWAGVAGAQGPGAGPETDMEESADLLLVGIPAIAFGLTFLMPDGDDDVSSASSGLFNGKLSMNGSPRHDLGLALLRTATVTYGLKYAVSEERPDGSGQDSFPSGHTAMTFAGAEFIRKQYGWTAGAPAYAAAGFVGWSRVATEDHWTHDVAIGALIGILSNHDLGGMLSRWGWRVEPAMLQAVPDPAFGPPSGETAPGLTFEKRF